MTHQARVVTDQLAMPVIQLPAMNLHVQNAATALIGRFSQYSGNLPSILTEMFYRREHRPRELLLPKNMIFMVRTFGNHIEI